jgi:hypothetical protein
MLHKRHPAMLAWSGLSAITLVLASLLQAVAATVLVVPEGTALPTMHLSVATATLADGDDTRARFLTNLPAETLAPPSVSCSAPATNGKPCIP